jgi:hypothetical protein
MKKSKLKRELKNAKEEIYSLRKDIDVLLGTDEVEKIIVKFKHRMMSDIFAAWWIGDSTGKPKSI